MGCGWILLLFFSTLSLIKCNHRSMCYWFCNCFLNGLGPKTAALVRMSFGLYIWANGWCIFLLGKPSNISVKDDLSQKAWLAMLYKVTQQRSFTCTSFVDFISDVFVAHWRGEAKGMDAVHIIIHVVMASQLKHVGLVLQKRAGNVWLVPKTGKLILDAHWASFNVCLETGWKRSCLYRGGGHRKERLHGNCIGMCTQIPSVEGNNFCKDSEGFGLSCVTSRTASLSSTIKSSLRCQWSLKYSWDSDLWYIWSLGVGFDEVLAYWEC